MDYVVALPRQADDHHKAVLLTTKALLKVTFEQGTFNKLGCTAIKSFEQQFGGMSNMGQLAGGFTHRDRCFLQYLKLIPLRIQLIGFGEQRFNLVAPPAQSLQHVTDQLFRRTSDVGRFVGAVGQQISVRISQLVEFANLSHQLLGIQRTGEAGIQFQLDRISTRQGLKGIDHLFPAHEYFKPACLV